MSERRRKKKEKESEQQLDVDVHVDGRMDGRWTDKLTFLSATAIILLFKVLCMYLHMSIFIIPFVHFSIQF